MWIILYYLALNYYSLYINRIKLLRDIPFTNIVYWREDMIRSFAQESEQV